MPRGLGFGSLSHDDDDTNGAGGLTLPPPKPKAAPAPLPKDALASEGARLGFVSREPGERSASQDVAPPSLDGPDRAENVSVPGSEPSARAELPSTARPPAPTGAPKPASKLKGRRRVPQSKLLVAGRKDVLDEFQQLAWEKDLAYWEALEMLLKSYRRA